LLETRGRNEYRQAAHSCQTRVTWPGRARATLLSRELRFDFREGSRDFARRDVHAELSRDLCGRKQAANCLTTAVVALDDGCMLAA
jgi:hypothetical protein